MKHKHLGVIILFGTLVLICLMVVQIYWFKKAFDVSERQFDHTVQVALKKVADSISRTAEVKKLSSNFFFVATNDQLNDSALDSLVKAEFLLRNLNMDYELGVYKAADDTLVYGNYVGATKTKWIEAEAGLHGKSEYAKNFAVYFPSKKSFIVAQLDIWIFSTIILLLMMIFFAYAITSLLKEKRFAELKNDFINTMTHEFKTPVTSINIAGEILKTKLQDAASQVYIDILLKENEKIRSKIDQVLLGSSSEYLKQIRFEPVDLHQIIADSVEAVQLKVTERKGIIELQCNATAPIVNGDRELLTQAIVNLIDNAEKYSIEKPYIVVKTQNHIKGIELLVIDHGIGIPEKWKKKVFEKFFRIRTGDVHTVKGFGLGLNFVKNIIHTHQGQVKLLSELHGGTEVRILLPSA